jgi:hypothetical protein
VVLLLVDSYDLATIAAIRYAKSLRPSALRAVHFSLDGARAAELRRHWLEAGTKIPLELADCPDRRLAHAAARLAAAEACEVADSTGELTAVFYGRTHITGLEPGSQVRLHGMVGIGKDGRLAMINPAYHLVR